MKGFIMICTYRRGHWNLST